MRAPSSDAAQAQMMQQYSASQAALQQQTAAYMQSQDAARAKAASDVAAQQAQLASAGQASKPVMLSTILTSAKGQLGNPPLALAKLGG